MHGFQHLLLNSSIVKGVDCVLTVGRHACNLISIDGGVPLYLLTSPPVFYPACSTVHTVISDHPAVKKRY